MYVRTYVCMYVCMYVCIMYVCMCIAIDNQAPEILHISKLWVLSVSLENSVSTKHFVNNMNGPSFCLLTGKFKENCLGF